MRLRDDETLKLRIAEAVREFELSGSSAWSDLDVLSTHTRVDGVDVEPEGVVIGEDGNFQGVINIYVSLQFGSDSDDGFTSSDSFLGEFVGHLDQTNEPIIEDVTVDTSDYYR
jgi:hypothetical protein